MGKLRPWGSFTFISGLFVGRLGRTFPHLIGNVLSLIIPVEEILIVLSKCFRAIAKEYDPARPDAEATPVVNFKVIVIRTVVKPLTDTGGAEFSYSPSVSRASGSLGLLARLAILWRSARAVAVSNPRCDLIVPLFFGLSVKQSNNDHGHVVAPQPSSRLTIGGETVIHHVLTDVI
jgi:hypothetical protein